MITNFSLAQDKSKVGLGVGVEGGVEGYERFGRKL